MTDFGWDLPAGVTDAMCEPFDPTCAGCGCLFSNHYEEDDGYINFPNNRDTDYDGQGIEYSSNGEVTHACDSLIYKGGKKTQCPCEKFVEGEYEPDYCGDDGY